MSVYLSVDYRVSEKKEKRANRKKKVGQIGKKQNTNDIYYHYQKKNDKIGAYSEIGFIFDIIIIFQISGIYLYFI